MKKPEEMIKWKLVTDKRPNENPHKKSSFRLEHSLGPLVEPTTTTAPNTTTPRPSTGELRIFILAINETGFYSQKFNQFYKEIQEKANEQGNVSVMLEFHCYSSCSYKYLRNLKGSQILLNL